MVKFLELVRGVLPSGNVEHLVEFFQSEGYVAASASMIIDLVRLRES